MAAGLDLALRRQVERAARALERPGAVVLYPTGTVYGLGGRASDGLAARRIARLKGRPLRPLVVLALDPPLPGPLARRLAERFWPGPLSLVLPPWPGLAPELLGPGGVAVRPPDHPAARLLVELAGPLSSTSANRSGEPPLAEPSGLPFEVDAVVDAGPLPPSPPSTLVDGRTGRVLREGAIPAAAIRAALEGA